MAVVVVFSLFFFKNHSSFQNQASKNSSLVYDGEKVADLVNKDTDGDGVPDWEEGLWGTDPTKKDTNSDGTPDGVEIANRKRALGENPSRDQAPENLTQTDKFSRELFSTVTALTQAGALGPSSADALGTDLASKMQNTVQRKIFSSTDIKVSNDASAQAVKNYNSAIASIYTSHPLNVSVTDILQKAFPDENNVDTAALADLDSVITNTNSIINAVLKVSVPKSIAPLHLIFINALEKVVENLSDIKLYDTDSVVALSAIGQYENNAAALESAVKNLQNAIIAQSGY